MFWGLSEAIDLFGEYLAISKEQNDIDEASATTCELKRDKEVNILLFGSNDPRHLIATMAKIYSHRAKGKNPVINFFVIDGCIEIVARNMALLAIALENSNAINIRNKTHLFMDVYGNALIRKASQQYIASKTKSLIKMITDSEYTAKIAPFLNIEGLKYRERDGLENTFNFWLPKEENIYNIKQYWSDRVRRHLATRYDYREGQFDWDLNMVLKERGGSQICSQEYRYWRETGIAFTFPEYEYNVPNKTFCAGLVRNGNTFMHRGYIGDIKTGPFVSFGLNTSDKRMLKSVHGENDYRSTDVTERNVMEILHELSTDTPYEHDLNQSRKYGCTRLQMAKSLINYDEEDLRSLNDYDDPWINVKGVTINFLSCDDIYAIQNGNNRWINYFDVVFVAHNYFPFLKATFLNILRPLSSIIMETKLMSTERKDVIEEFEAKLFAFAKSGNLRPVLNYEALNTRRFYLKFMKYPF
ncbi:dynein axonemal assembly factor 3 [Haematobia irritans]|uniref:dynein axonemal assembly factor 3 n=1 Tax=Haematobia irritans TaxID=7368 RepID=UPI003F4F557D